MKKKFLGLLILFSVSDLKSQTVVTFENNVFKINGSPFLPIGWYDGSTPAELDEQKAVGANTVLILGDQDDFLNANGGDSTQSGYSTALQNFLIKAHDRNMMVIVQIPYKKWGGNNWDPNDAISDDSWLDAILLNPQIVNSPGLLGWYIADEPEMPNHWQTQQYSRLQHVYQKLRFNDQNHPVFVCCHQGYFLDNQTVETNPQWKEPNNQFPPGLPFFDVLMEDLQDMILTIDAHPSPNLSTFDLLLPSLYDCFQSYAQHGLPASTSVLVAQGYSDATFRPHDPVEIKYQIFSSLFLAQRNSYYASKNAGGILFWRYGASALTKANINKFINYFTSNSLDVVIRQPKLNSLVTGNTIPFVETFLRYYNNSYYLFAINRSGGSQSGSITLNLGNVVNCSELKVGASDTKPLVSLGSGNYRLDETFLAREAKVYKILSPFSASISGPTSFYHRPTPGLASNQYT